MCTIRYLRKIPDSGIIEDSMVKISGKEYEVLDKPYYVVRTDLSNNSEFLFHYIDNSESSKVISNDYFTITYGLLTGRLYKFIVNIPINQHVPNEIWELYKKNDICATVFSSEIAKNNVIFGFGVIKKLYFKDYTKVED